MPELPTFEVMYRLTYGKQPSPDEIAEDGQVWNRLADVAIVAVAKAKDDSVTEANYRPAAVARDFAHVLRSMKSPAVPG